MNTGKGKVAELLLEDECRHLRISCPPGLIPSPGQYLLAADGSDSPLPVPLFHTDSASQGFVAAASAPAAWIPGLELQLRGPLGRGFTLPLSARRVGLIALAESPARLKGMIRPALTHDAAVVLVCDSNPDNLSDEVEVQPMSALQEILEWADYFAVDVVREDLRGLQERVGKLNQLPAEKAAQVLVHTPVPCGGVADCGVCAVTFKSGWRLACREGPVFDLREME